MAFQIKTAGVPVDESFWYRMALLNVQTAINDNTTPENFEAYDELFEALHTAWRDLFEQQQQARLAAEASA
jgi:hypothetical protein